MRVGSYIPTPALTPTSAHSTDLSAFNSSNNRIALSGYDYDPAGNLEGDPTTGANAIVYDAENRMTSYTKSGMTTTYAYDGDGRRVSKTDSSGTLVFVYNASGQLIADYSTATQTGTLTTSYLTTDHLGSTRVVTNDTGGVKARHDLLPFGEEIASNIGGRGGVAGYTAQDSTRQRFTGHERDDESGLDFMQARYCSSAQGRFTSPDEFKGGPQEFWVLGSGDEEKQALPYAEITNPQSLNKYQYGFNSPLRYIDPDGHQSQDGDYLESLREFAEALGLLKPKPLPNPVKQGVLNQRIPRTGGMKYADGLKVEVKAIEEAGETLGLVLGVLDPTGQTSVAHNLAKGDSAGATFAAIGAGLNFRTPTMALQHFGKHALEWGFGKFTADFD